MPSSTLFMGVGIALSALSSTATATVYTSGNTYEGSSFLDGFNFFTDADPTNGFVTYVDPTTSGNAGLTRTINGAQYIGVDYTNVYSTAAPGGRKSVRIETKENYNEGLFILDLKHMPGSTCGSWPAFWSVGSGTWPQNGEIDIIEGVNLNSANQMVLHTATDCTVDGLGQSASQTSYDCALTAGTAGCAAVATEPETYGTNFNINGGGIYAMEWTDDFIKMWFFPRNSIPDAVTSAHPDTSKFGTPMVNFAGSCDIKEKFQNHRFIFDTTFCGDWAGNVYASSGCPMYTGLSGMDSCKKFVAENPGAFSQSYWLINSFKTYDKSAASSSSAGVSSTSSSSSLVSSSMVAESTSHTAAPSIAAVSTSSSSSVVATTSSRSSAMSSSMTASSSSVAASTSSMSSAMSSSMTASSSSVAASTSTMSSSVSHSMLSSSSSVAADTGSLSSSMSSSMMGSSTSHAASPSLATGNGSSIQRSSPTSSIAGAASASSHVVIDLSTATPSASPSNSIVFGNSTIGALSKSSAVASASEAASTPCSESGKSSSPSSFTASASVPLSTPCSESSKFLTSTLNAHGNGNGNEKYSTSVTPSAAPSKSSANYNVGSSGMGNNYYTTVYTTAYVDVCPTGYTTISTTHTWVYTKPTSTATPALSSANQQETCPPGFTVTPKVCNSGCGATPTIVTVTIPVTVCPLCTEGASTPTPSNENAKTTHAVPVQSRPTKPASSTEVVKVITVPVVPIPASSPAANCPGCLQTTLTPLQSSSVASSPEYHPSSVSTLVPSNSRTLATPLQPSSPVACPGCKGTDENGMGTGAKTNGTMSFSFTTASATGSLSGGPSVTGEKALFTGAAGRVGAMGWSGVVALVGGLVMGVV